MQALPTSAPALVLLAGFTAQAPPPPDAAVTRETLTHHVAALAAVEHGGREAGTPGSARAARYLARALERAGVQPGGDDGTFLQRIAAVRAEHRSVPRLVVTENSGERIEAVYGADFHVAIRGEARSTPELAIRRITTEWDMPDEEKADEALFFRATPKERKAWFRARDMGTGAGFGLEVVVAHNALAGKPKEAPAPVLLTEPFEEDGCELVTLRGDLREKLLWKGIRSLQLFFEEERRAVEEYNVIGILPGCDPELASEAIVLAASYDHDGHEGHDRQSEPEGVPAAGSRLRGANDASGCAVLLELAESFAAEPPARTVVFLFLTGSKHGRFGSAHYLEHPLVPLERTCACLVLKRLGKPGGDGGPWLTGYERTNLAASFAEHGVDVLREPRRQRNLFQRMESFPFAERGIVAQTFSSGEGSEGGGESLDYGHLAACAETILAGCRLLADGTIDPEWLPGGEPWAR